MSELQQQNSKWLEPLEAGQNNFKQSAISNRSKKNYYTHEQRTRIITVESHLEVEAGLSIMSISGKEITSHFDAHFLK